MDRRFSNKFFKEHQRMLDNFMRDFDTQFDDFGFSSFPQRLLSFQPLQTFHSDDFFLPIEHQESQEEIDLKQQFQKEYMDLKNKYEKKILTLEQQKEKESKKKMEIEPKSDEKNYTYNYQQFREFKNGKETGKIVEQKQKMVGDQQVTEKTTTHLLEDGTKEIEEEIIDEKGSTITKKRLGKDDKPLPIQ